MLTSYTIKNITHFLNEHDDLKTIQKQVEQLLALKKDIEQIIPKHYHAQVSPSLIKDKTVLIFVENQLLANKLRQLTPTITQQLKAFSWPIERIQIKLVPASNYNKIHIKQNKLSAYGLSELAKLSANLENSPLKNALDQMIARHKK